MSAATGPDNADENSQTPEGRGMYGSRDKEGQMRDVEEGKYTPLYEVFMFL